MVLHVAVNGKIETGQGAAGDHIDHDPDHAPQ